MALRVRWGMICFVVLWLAILVVVAFQLAAMMEIARIERRLIEIDRRIEDTERPYEKR